MVNFAPHFLTSRVMHKRLRPRLHDFNYGVFYLCVPLSRIAELPNACLSVDRWNLLGFYRRDHGRRDGSDLDAWIRGILRHHQLRQCDGEIVLITLPRILGYVFNPVSFWLCFDRQGGLRAVLSEVANTFGEHHSYLSYHDDHAVILPQDRLQARKLFHVSPFLDIAGYYEFRFSYSRERVSIGVNLFDDEGLLLTTSITGQPLPYSAGQALRLFLSYPLVTLKTIALIHVEAVRLLLKGMRYRPKPPPPAEEVTR